MVALRAVTVKSKLYKDSGSTEILKKALLAPFLLPIALSKTPPLEALANRTHRKARYNS